MKDEDFRGNKLPRDRLSVDRRPQDAPGNQPAAAFSQFGAVGTQVQLDS